MRRLCHQQVRASLCVSRPCGATTAFTRSRCHTNFPLPCHPVVCVVSPYTYTHRPPRVLKQRLLASRATPPKRVNFSPPFAAIIPGDTVVEQVFTTGLNNFL